MTAGLGGWGIPTRIQPPRSAQLTVGFINIILFKTQNSDRAFKSDTFVENFVHISTKAAHYLAEKKVRTVGVDYLSVGGYRGNVVEVHHALLSSGIWALSVVN
ncbi:MAG: cyclase family protein [Xenococcaceae cyanobacterium MO_188.B32]|nr:cyclase family protein [Xenococcaceae cyanobacterium MO_188.B32]